MSQTVITVLVDTNTKEMFDEFCSEIGMSATTAINVYIKKIIRDRKIPFEIGLPEDSFYSESNMRHLHESIAQYEREAVRQLDLVEV